MYLYLDQFLGWIDSLKSFKLRALTLNTLNVQYCHQKMTNLTSHFVHPPLCVTKIKDIPNLCMVAMEQTWKVQILGNTFTILTLISTLLSGTDTSSFQPDLPPCKPDTYAPHFYEGNLGPSEICRKPFNDHQLDKFGLFFVD